MGLTIPTLSELRDKGLQAVDNTIDKSENAMVYDAVSAGAVFAFELLSFAKVAFDKMDINNNTGTDLERFVYQRTGIVRQRGTKASGFVTFTGDAGTLVPQHFEVMSGSVVFKTVYGDVIAESGTVTIQIEAVEYGNMGYFTAGAINTIPTPLNGVTGVANAEPIKNGYNPESDAELRARYWMYFQDHATSNNPAHYRLWAKEIPGVGQVRVQRAFNGPLTVKLVLLDDRYQSASPELCAQVKAYIETKQSFDVKELVVVGATQVPINIVVSLQLANGYDDAAVKGVIADNVRTWLSTYADPSYQRRMVSYFDIATIIKQTAGVLDIVSLTINGGTANIELGDDEVAEVGTVS